MFRRSSILKIILATPPSGAVTVTPAIRSTLLAAFLRQRRSLFLSGLASGFVALMAVIQLHQVWTYIWLAADVAVFTWRLAISAAYSRNNQRHGANAYIWLTRYAPLGLGACLILGTGAMLSVMSLDAPLATLVLMVAAGIFGGIASRNAVLPRLAFLQILVGVIPIMVGALLTPGGAYWILVPPCLIYLASMWTLVKNAYMTLVSLMFAEQTNAELAARFDAALRYMPHGLCTTDDNGRVIVANKKIAELFGATVQTLKLNVMLPEFIGNVSLPAFGETFRKQLVERCTAWLEQDDRSLEFQLANGRSLHMTRSQVPDGSEVIIIEDVSEQRLIESELRYLARHDALTGLPNRRYFHDHVVGALQDHVHDGDAQSLTVLCLDLDGFKAVNDRYGHSAGDEVLQVLVARIKKRLPVGAVFARLGGDEFAIAIPDISALAVTSLAATLVSDMIPPVCLATGTRVLLGLSVGIAVAGPGEPFHALMGRADAALYEAKSAGKSTYRFADEMVGA